MLWLTTVKAEGEEHERDLQTAVVETPVADWRFKNFPIR